MFAACETGRSVACSFKQCKILKHTKSFNQYKTIENFFSSQHGFWRTSLERNWENVSALQTLSAIFYKHYLSNILKVLQLAKVFPSTCLKVRSPGSSACLEIFIFKELLNFRFLKSEKHEKFRSDRAMGKNIPSRKLIFLVNYTLHSVQCKKQRIEYLARLFDRRCLKRVLLSAG